MNNIYFDNTLEFYINRVIYITYIESFMLTYRSGIISHFDNRSAPRNSKQQVR